MKGSYAPISTSAVATGVAAPLPRFADTATDRSLLRIIPPPTAPPVPVLLGPANGATGVAAFSFLTWQVNPAQSFDVYVDTVNPPAALAGSSTFNGFKTTGLAPLTTYYWKVIAKNESLSSIASEVWSFTTGPASGLRFVPVTPCRVVDTREANLGAFGAPAVAGGTFRSFRIPEKPGCNIPAEAQAYSINATVVPKGPLGYLTLWPTGQSQPFVSTLNSLDGRVKANAAIVPAGRDGAISAFATADTELIIDISGYFIDAADKLAYYPLTPCRILDTRNANGSLGGPVLAGGGSGRDIPILSSNCGVPASAQAYSLNATVVPSGPLGYLTLWPAGEGQPVVSTLNAPGGGVVANAAIVKAGLNGSVSAFVSNASHLVLDINGYFAPSGAAANPQRYFAATPCRLVDTRNPDGEFGGAILAGGAERSYRLPLAAGCGVPAGATAAVLNATVVPAGGLGYLTLWPFGSARPFVSTLNAGDGAITSNMALVPAGTSGAVASFVTNGTHLILDTSGYFAP